MAETHHKVRILHSGQVLPFPSSEFAQFALSWHRGVISFGLPLLGRCCLPCIFQLCPRQSEAAGDAQHMQKQHCCWLQGTQLGHFSPPSCWGNRAQARKASKELQVERQHRAGGGDHNALSTLQRAWWPYPLGGIQQCSSGHQEPLSPHHQ